MNKKALNNAVLISAPLALYAGFKLYEAFDFSQKVSIELKNINIKAKQSADSDYSKLVFDLILILRNPTNYEGRISKINIDVYGNGKYLGNLSNTSGFMILKKKIISLHNDLTINTDKAGEIVEAIIEAINTKKFKLHFIGSMKTSFGTFKINQVQNV